MAALDYWILALYFLLMLGIGLFVTSKIKRYKDYFLAGGALTTPLLVCTLVSTYYSLDVTFTTSEIGFDHGLAAWFWFSRPYYLGIFLAAILLVKRLRAHPDMTLPDILGRRYGNGTRAIGAAACFVYSLPVLSISGIAIMFELVGWQQEKWIAVALGVGICALYTMMGGLWADAITDTLQFVLMCVSLAIAVPGAIGLVGGFEGIESKLEPHYFEASGNVSKGEILSWCLISLSVFVEPTFYQRIFAAKSTKDITRSLILGIFLWAAYDWICTLLGMAGQAAVRSGILDKELEGSKALFALCMQTLPVGLKGLFIAGLLAAVMSTVDTYSLLAAGNLVYDIYRPLVKPDMDDRALIRWTRIGVLVVMLVGVAVEMLFEKFADAWVFLASSLTSVVFVPTMGALFFSRVKKAAGFYAALGGAVALAVFYVLLLRHGEYVEARESYRCVIGGWEIWREFAVLFALPVSALAFAAGQLWGRKTENAS